jgi:hypothetical protein
MIVTEAVGLSLLPDAASVTERMLIIVLGIAFGAFDQYLGSLWVSGHVGFWTVDSAACQRRGWHCRSSSAVDSRTRFAARHQSPGG